MEPLQRLSLVQQITQLEDVGPVDLDPEDVQVTGINPEPDLAIAVDNSAARTHYVAVSPSSLRKLHESLLDSKYEGTKTSRRLMLDESDDSERDSASEDAKSTNHVLEVSPGIPTADRETTVRHKVDARCTTRSSMEHRSAAKQDNDLSSSLRKTREEDRKKGKAISRQIALWDSLLDARIRLQKSVTAGNCLLPSSQITVNEQVYIPLMKMLEEARSLSNELFDLQEGLLSANESIQPPPRKRRKNTESDYAMADYAEDLREAGRAVSELECAYHPHLVQTLTKWSSKIQAVAPSILLPSNRNTFSKTTQYLKSAPHLIDETLADHSKVLARTRIYRGKGSRPGVSTTDGNRTREKEDPEVFDDTDFYHQLLRDVIEARGNGTSNNDEWVAVQKEKKAKKKVDTKASKGRKLRYEVHEKIQNFMAPMLTQGSWHEEQIDELFASLLGKGFERAMQEVGETVDKSLQEEVNAALQGGFRVFG